MGEPEVLHEWDSKGMPGPYVRWAVDKAGCFYADHAESGRYTFINISQPSKELARLAARLRELEADKGALVNKWDEALLERDQARAEARRLREVLTYYAGQKGPIGNRARAALAPAPEET